jgi:MFS family permease
MGFLELRTPRDMLVTNRGYRWVIVAAGALLGCVAIGAMFSLPVFLTPMAGSTGWSRTGISLAMTIGFLAMAFGSVFWGTVTDRFGPRMVVLAGLSDLCPHDGDGDGLV